LRPIYYDHESENHTLAHGILAAKNKRHMEVCLDRIHGDVGKSVAECQVLVAKEAE